MNIADQRRRRLSKLPQPVENQTDTAYTGRLGPRSQVPVKAAVANVRECALLGGQPSATSRSEPIEAISPGINPRGHTGCPAQGDSDQDTPEQVAQLG